MTGTVEIAHRFGVTYRQVDYWVRSGYLSDTGDPDFTGSGVEREFTDDQAARLDLLCRLVATGIRPSRAAIYARIMTANRTHTLTLPGNVTITVGDPS